MSAVDDLGGDTGRPKSARIYALDGLRGWAALSVLIYHLTWELFGIKYPIYRNALSALLGNGALAVAIFLSLSGYVLTIGRWHRTDNGNLLLTLIRRYFRLAIPILAAVLLMWALMSLGLTFTQEAAAILKRKNWLGHFADFRPDFVDALVFAFGRTFIYVRDNNYGPFLWTMAIELWCSFCVLMASQGNLLLRERYTVLLLLAVFLLHIFPLAACVPAGAIVALLQRDGIVFHKEPGELESFVATCALIAAWVVAACFQYLFSNALPVSVCGVVVFVATLRSRPARTFFSLPVSQWLGRISFPLYLTQIAVIISLSSWLVVTLAAARALNAWSALGVGAVSLVAGILVAVAFLPVERFTLATIRLIGRRRPAPAAPTTG